MKKLTAKRIAKLRKKIKHYRLYDNDRVWGFKKEDRWTRLYGLNENDALKRYEKRVNRGVDWDREGIYFSNAWGKEFADKALVPEGITKREQILWLKW